MRDHGISDFPDPEPGFGIAIEPCGGIAIVGEPDLDQDNPQFNAAEKACKSLLPPPQPPSEEQQQQEWAQMLEFANCIREHGFSSFPDPKPGEGFPPSTPASIPRSTHPTHNSRPPTRRAEARAPDATRDHVPRPWPAALQLNGSNGVLTCENAPQSSARRTKLCAASPPSLSQPDPRIGVGDGSCLATGLADSRQRM
jgi:hypothetical protein